MNSIFKQSMEIGAIFYKKYYDERTWEWSASDKCPTMTKMTIEYAEENNISLECALDVVMKELFENDFDTLEDHLWDDYCKGFLAGEILGMPTKENLVKVRKAEKLWEDVETYGYYQEVLDEVLDEF